MHLIVGLGNPGEEYTGTRHNTGRIIVETLEKKWSDGKIGAEKVEFLTPDTFMNNSGKAVGPKIKSASQAKKLIVIHDDLDLPIGTLKISYNRGAGGHRGVDSIIKAIKTQEFVRFRVGISPSTTSGKLKKPSGEEAVNKFIIGKFKPSELLVVKKMAKTAAEAVETIVSDSKSGLARAMTIFNS